MIPQIFFSILFLLITFVELEAQQASTERVINEETRIVFISNSVEEFNYQLLRLETAWEENDKESVDAIVDVIKEKMKKYLEQSQDYPSQTVRQKDNLACKERSLKISGNFLSTPNGKTILKQ